ncbi:hypothetical protein V1264_020844 [Littorina saxatilis]|uniref:Fibrinogen C-terminal domain-containing protein n=1 Tax=Littorina saxatilis TaxID=31220 RepID=A0AAN9BDG5_9CAEN
MFRCENGGTHNGTRCQCPLPFAGTHCQRYMKDCTEGFENGHQDRHQGIYLIQPMTSLNPFLVRCRFDWGGVTYPLSRRVRDTSWSSVTWTQAKDGLGDDLAVAPDSRNYFVGLDKLYQLLSQGSYVGLIASSYSTSFIGISAFFFNFTVGPESSGYRLTYDSFSTNAIKPALNGLNASSPLLFSASGNDGNGCAEVRGAPGWYGSDCSGHSMFADPPTWPVPDQGTPVLNAIELALTRS